MEQAVNMATTPLFDWRVPTDGYSDAAPKRRGGRWNRKYARDRQPVELDDASFGQSERVDFFWNPATGQYRRAGLAEGSWELPSLARAKSMGQSPELIRKAELMVVDGLETKAKRQAFCERMGTAYECTNTDCRGKLFKPFRCRNRYCPNCARTLFDELFRKHLRLKEVAERLVPHWPCSVRPSKQVMAKIDFTAINKGYMPSPEEIRQFNRDVRETMRRLAVELGIKSSDFGFLWCNEFGSPKSKRRRTSTPGTNLHAHGIYAGPWIPWTLLSQTWQAVRADGSFRVSIKAARSFGAGLAHALKYAGKFVSSNPERLAQLEKAFHRVRRVHVLGAFYNPVLHNPPVNEDVTDDCPHCGSALKRKSAFVPLVELIAAGYQHLDSVRQQVRRARVLSGTARGSP